MSEKSLSNEKGFTLTEIVVSILILMIVFTIILKFFPQIGFVNMKSAEKNQAINIAKDELIYWKEELNSKERFLDFLDNIHNHEDFIQTCPHDTDESCNIMKLQTSENYPFYAKITLSKDSELDGPIMAHNIHIQIIDNHNHAKVSETYGYIIYEDDSELD